MLNCYIGTGNLKKLEIEIKLIFTQNSISIRL